MTKTLTALFFLGCSHFLLAQQEEERLISCVDSSQFRVLNINGPKLNQFLAEVPSVIREMSDLSFDQLGYDCDFQQIDEKGSSELILYWEGSSYGSGGGFELKGILIWNLDRSLPLLFETLYCSEESFGRFGSEHYLASCQKEIKVIDGKLLIGSQSCSDNIGQTQDPTENFPLSQMEAGEYLYIDGEWKRP